MLAAAHGRVFAGIRNGRLLALSLRTGDLLWSQQVVPPHTFPEGYLNIGAGQQLWVDSAPEPSIIETQPAILDDRIVVGTHARSIVSYLIDSGRRAWQWQLDAPAVGAVLPFMNGVLLHTRNRVYCLRGWDGWVLWQREFPDEDLCESFACGTGVAYFTTRDVTRGATEGARATLALDGRGVHARRPVAGLNARLRWDAATGLLYELTDSALSILDPGALTPAHEIGLEPGERSLAWAITPETIYLLTQSFSQSVTTSLTAIAHPG